MIPSRTHLSLSQPARLVFEGGSEKKIKKRNVSIIEISLSFPITVKSYDEIREKNRAVLAFN